MSKKKEDKKLTKDQAEKKILTLKKDLFNIRFKKVNNWLANKGIETIEIDLREISKQGGLFRCTTLPLIRK